MNKLFVLTVFTLLTAFNFQSNAQEKFPAITAESLDRNSVTIPDDLSDKKSIIFLAFTERAEEMLDSWYGPVYTMFLDKSGFNAMAYDCHVKLVMMFTGVGQSMANTITEKIRSNVNEDFNDYLMFYQGNFKSQMDALDLKKKNDAYVFVLDENGKILYHDVARYSDSKLEKIADMVEL